MTQTLVFVRFTTAVLLFYGVKQSSVCVVYLYMYNNGLFERQASVTAALKN